MNTTGEQIINNDEQEQDRASQVSELLTQLEELEKSGTVPLPVLDTLQAICQSFLIMDNEGSRESGFDLDCEIRMHLACFSATNPAGFNAVN